MDTSLWIGDATREGAKTKVVAPWSRETLAEVTLADASAAEAAVALASKVAADFARVPGHARRDGLARVAQALLERRGELATLLAQEAAKPITAARAEVDRAISTFRIASEEATRLGGEALALDVTTAGEGARGVVWRVPAGPVLGIAPFNFPLNLVAHKVAPALACGCPIVLKPPPQTPLSSLFLAGIVRESFGFSGALTVLPCAVDVAESLVKDDRFAVLSFTGSDKVGWHLKSVAGKKRVLLELGGNAAAIVHRDAPLDFAVTRIALGAFGYAGQVCIKVQRVMVHQDVYDDFVSRFLDATKRVVPLSPLDESALMSAMIDDANAARVDAWVDEGISRGASCLLRGAREGNRLGPSVLAFEGAGTGAKVVDEEAFGPVVTLHRYREWDEALAMADATRYGLQAGVFTDSRELVARAFERLHVGALIVGDAPTFRVDNMPYGGTRDSGLGREGVRYAMEEMTLRKLMVERRV